VICIYRILPGLMSFVLSVYASTTSAQTQPPPVYGVLFTHIEDNTPAGALGTQQSRQNYLLYRGKLIAVANLCLSYNVPWSLQPDWKFLLAALLYEDSSLVAATNGKNLLRYLKEEMNVAIDPHSHEQQGYNYTDIAHLLDSLGVGGSTVIGGHIWDPSLPQFQQWDRFRVPVPGSRYPWARWRGDILMGSGTPNHVNDPLISGVWRPKDRHNYFVDDPPGNIVGVGQYKGDAASVAELSNLYASGVVSPQFMLTASIHIKPATIIAANAIGTIENSVLIPLVALRDSGKVKLTDFTSLIADWETLFGSRAYLYDPNSTNDHPINWKPFFTLEPEEGTSLVLDSTAVIPNASVPGPNISNDGRVILGYAAGPGGRGQAVSNDNGRTFTLLSGYAAAQAGDGAFVYLPDARTRYITEEPLRTSTPQRHKSCLVSWISSDGINWSREAGVRYQPGAEDDSIASVPAVLQVADSVWRIYYVGDFYRTNGTRTAISTDWGWTWRPESKKNILRDHDVDPHPVYLTNGRIRIYHRHMKAPGGIAYTEGDGLAFDTTRTTVLLPDGVGFPGLLLDPAVIKYPNSEIACYIGAVPFLGQPGRPKIIAAWAQKLVAVEQINSRSSTFYYELQQNYPNPFNPSTTIRFSLPQREHVRLKVFDVIGKEVATLVEGELNAGKHAFQFQVAESTSGVFFYRLTTNSFVETKKMLYLDKINDQIRILQTLKTRTI